MVEVSFRAARPADAAAIAAVHVASWRDAYEGILEPEFLAGPVEADRLSLWTARLADAAPVQLVEVAEDRNGRLVAFTCAYRDHDSLWGSLVDNLHVLPGLRGHGIGERLLRSAARNLREAGAQGGVHLWVFEANQAGLRFYQRLGGRVAGRDVSHMPAASGRTVLRVYWPTLDALA